MTTILRLLLLIPLAAALSGCLVAESKYLQKVAEADGLTQELAGLQKKYDALTAENSALKESYTKLSAEHAVLIGAKARADATVADLNKDLKSSKSESQQRIGELRQKVDDLAAENARLKQEVDRLFAENGKLKDEAARLKAETERLGGEIAGLQKAKEEVQKTSQTYEQLLDKMKGEIAQGQVTISELKGKLTVNLVDAVLFDSGKAEVKEDGLAVLQKVVDILKTVKDKTIRIEGHTDNVQIRGLLATKYATNWELSAARAINVTRFLQQQGLEPAALAAAAYGEYKPVAPNDSDEGRAKNRRIEIVLVAKE